MNAKRMKVALYVVRRFKTGTHQLISEEAQKLLTPELAAKLREKLHQEKDERQCGSGGAVVGDDRRNEVEQVAGF